MGQRFEESNRLAQRLLATLLAGVLCICVGCSAVSNRLQTLGSPSSSVVAETLSASNDANIGADGPDVPQILEAPLPTAPDANKINAELRGRIEADAVFVHQSARNQAIVGDLQNAVGFRRARLGAQGTVGDQVSWVAEFDFAGGRVAFRDVYVAVEKLPIVGEVRVGNFREPFSLAGQTSSNYFTFIERSPADALDPARHWGLGVFNHLPNERVTLAAGVFRSGSDTTGAAIGDGNDLTYSGRVTALPWLAADDRLMHVGGAFGQVSPANGVVAFNQGTQNNLLPIDDNPLTPFVPNLQIPAAQFQRYNAEWAAVLGPLSFQAEWNAAYIDQIGGAPVLLHGAYAFASYFLTGEHRNYDRKRGAFGPTSVHAPFACRGGQRARGLGAWELTARFAYLDFRSDALSPTPAGLRQGNRIAETTLGVNWYLNDNSRFLFNYVHSIPVDPNFGPSAADAFFARLAVFW